MTGPQHCKGDSLWLDAKFANHWATEDLSIVCWSIQHKGLIEEMLVYFYCVHINYIFQLKISIKMTVTMKTISQCIPHISYIYKISPIFSPDLPNFVNTREVQHCGEIKQV